MYKNHLNSAMEKITANEEFKNELISSMEVLQVKRKRMNIKLLYIAAASFILVIGLLAVQKYHRSQNSAKHTDDFEIIGSYNDGLACYIGVLYLDGYEYMASSWIFYDKTYGTGIEGYEMENKIGEVTLDLKGTTYIGTPPDYASTYDIGTEIYTIKGFKKEYALLMKTQYNNTIFFRTGKHIVSNSDPIDLTISDIYHMLGTTSTVNAVELRNEEDGSWLRTSEDEALLTMINEELPNLQLMNWNEVKQDLNSKRVVVNLMNTDGTVLTLHTYPKQKYASVFGGYIKLSDELSQQILTLDRLGASYPRITEVLQIETNEISDLWIKDYVDGREIICTEPNWSGAALLETINNYRLMDDIEQIKGNLVMSFKINESELKFFETEDLSLSIQINGKNYRIVKGRIRYQDLLDYLNNFI